MLPGRLVGPAEAGLCIGEFSRGPPARLLVKGEEGAEPAEVERKERGEVTRRERASLTREGMEEEEGGGEGVEGERAKTGTEEKCSRGILKIGRASCRERV